VSTLIERPKRKYTVSERVLAANRRNLARANAVDKAIRFRMTRKRRISCHRNLVRAQIVRQTSGRYGPIRHGLYCASLERSLELAGETPSEFSAHLAAWDGALAAKGEEGTPKGRPYELGPEQREPAPEAPAYGATQTSKNDVCATPALDDAALGAHEGRPDDSGEGHDQWARPLGLASWRRLRVFRGQARWEERRLGLCLAEAIHRAPTVVAEDRAEHARQLMHKVIEVFCITSLMDALIEQLHRRIERLLELWIESATGERVRLKHFARRRGGDFAAGERPDEALANPLVGPGRVGKSLLPKPPVSVKAPAFWGARDWDADLSDGASWRGAPTSDLTASLEKLTQAFEAALLAPLGGDGALEELRGLVGEVAELAWKRLEYFRGLARAEA
jgi:hypothetical protein